ncbi:MAG: DUF3048 domain-containing protein [Anaerolineae bacterium]|nr:DUF3048 domain-containing protein [Anaerolineae bacterium]
MCGPLAATACTRSRATKSLDKTLELRYAAEMNPLTGLMVPSWKLNRRPLGIKIPNLPSEARPQSGLSRADVVIEREAEAYLTRFTAIFMGGDAYPVGPLRSVRLIDGELMSIFRSTLVASGGHPAVKLRATQGKAWAAGYKRTINRTLVVCGSLTSHRRPAGGMPHT